MNCLNTMWRTSKSPKGQVTPGVKCRNGSHSVTCRKPGSGSRPAFPGSTVPPSSQSGLRGSYTLDGHHPIHVPGTVCKMHPEVLFYHNLKGEASFAKRWWSGKNSSSEISEIISSEDVAGLWVTCSHSQRATLTWTSPAVTFVPFKPETDHTLSRLTFRWLGLGKG